MSNTGGGTFEYGKENLVHEIRLHWFAISYEEFVLHLNLSFTSVEIGFNPLEIRHRPVLKQTTFNCK